MDEPTGIIGECRRVSLTSISEVGWWDTERMLADLKPHGGMSADQWGVPFPAENAAGSATLAEVEDLQGRTTRFLIDTGWNPAYMGERLRELGIDQLLIRGEIAFLYLTHEHLDHFWGVEAVLRHRPDIEIVAPSTFRPEAREFLTGRAYPGAENSAPHTGRLRLLDPGSLHPLLPGCASAVFDIPIVPSVRGEQSLVFRVRDCGLVLATGCCHQNIGKYAAWVHERLPDEAFYGLYGGLHLTPFSGLTEEAEREIERLSDYGFAKMALNHCTGLAAVEKMRELGYPLVEGAARAGSKSRLYLGNGDRVTFG